MKQTIDSELYLKMVRGGRSRLFKNKKSINDLNVFPIPDGDTGDNMFMTIDAGANCQALDSLGKTARQVSSAMLLGARGNSGVILSRIFAGISKGLSASQEASVIEFADAFKSGVEESYKAVSIPVEGTILTVFREGTEYAQSACNGSLTDYLAKVEEGMAQSLERTPDLLPVLKEAGVIDSGGAGILTIIRGMKDALESDVEDIPSPAGPSQAKAINLDAFTSESTLEFGYCTEFLLRLQSAKVDLDSFDAAVINEYLCSVGESVVCFREDSVVKVHVHTKTPGDILSYCQRWGEYLTLKIENMALQHNEITMNKESAQKDEFKVSKKYGVVCVANGEGIINTMKEAGADYIVEGGQTMNPSASDFIEAFDKVEAQTIFVYPNNSNIIMTALQAASLYEKSRVIVLPTKTIGAGYVAIASLDKSCKDVDEMVEAQKEIISATTCALVSKANRQAQMDGVSVNDGDYIGICNSAILTDSDDLTQATVSLCDKIEAGDHDVILIFKGCDTSEAEAETLYNTLSNKYPRTEIMLTDGGQAVYNYIITLC